MFNGWACVSHLADKRKRWSMLELLIDLFVYGFNLKVFNDHSKFLCVSSANLIEQSLKCNPYWEKLTKCLVLTFYLFMLMNLEFSKGDTVAAWENDVLSLCTQKGHTEIGAKLEKSGSPDFCPVP